MIIYIDTEESILTSLDDLQMRDKIVRIGIRKESESAFTAYAFVEQGVPLISYTIDATDVEPGIIHSLPFYNGILSPPEDRVSLDTLVGVPALTAMKAEIGNLRMNYRPNDVLYYVIPGTMDVVVYSRAYTFFENVEPVLANSNDVHMLLAQCQPDYVDPRPMDTLRLKTILQLDANDTLAYLEAQTDMLTRLVVSVLERAPELRLLALEDVPEYANFKAAVMPHLVSTVKNDTKCLAEISVGKANARAVQRDYYAQRQRMREEVNHG